MGRQAVTGRRRVQPRRVIWQRPTPRKKAVDDLVDTRHRHGCVTCSHVYEDMCLDPTTNRLCNGCRGHPPPLWETNLRPQECCTGSQPATRTEEQTYRLAGDGQWWLCPTCKRPHTYRPRKATP